MKRVYKLVLSCVLCALCVSLLAFGVYAAAKIDYETTNTITYELENVYCTISGTITGAYSDDDGTLKTDNSFSWTNVKSDGNVEVGKTNPTWTLGGIHFYNENPTQEIVISIEIENEMNQAISVVPTFTPTNTALYVETGATAGSGTAIEYSLNYSIAKSGTTVTIPAEGTLTATLTLSLYNEDISFEGAEFNWLFHMSTGN